MNYIEVTIHIRNSELQEMLIAQLSEVGFYGFVEEEEVFKAYISEADFNEGLLKSILGNNQIVYKLNTIEEQNWNQLWESNFEPITVDDFVGVRAAFHQPLHNVQHEIIITPKMSFGTGHHATTWMMMKNMEALSFPGKSVFDFGTGTGILAILAEKLGAAEVLAMDYDDWCIENATENIETNDCSKIILLKGDTANVMQQFDIILANINRNIIENNFNWLVQNLKPRGTLLLSGLLVEDEDSIVKQAKALGLKDFHVLNRNGWISIVCN